MKSERELILRRGGKFSRKKGITGAAKELLYRHASEVGVIAGDYRWGSRKGVLFERLAGEGEKKIGSQ